jgi:hypothetical protein
MKYIRHKNLNKIKVEALKGSRLSNWILELG